MHHGKNFGPKHLHKNSNFIKKNRGKGRKLLAVVQVFYTLTNMDFVDSVTPY